MNTIIQHHTPRKIKTAALYALLAILCALWPTGTAHAAKLSDYATGHQAAILYNNTNGLPTSEANSIAQTSDGFLWIGSYRGLTRYDGNSFFSYDSVNGVPGVVSLYVDTKDRLWIGTNDNGLAMFSNQKFTSYSDSETLASRSIRSICEDADGNILVGTTMGVGYVDENLELHLLNDPQINGEYVDELRRDSEGVVYGRTLAGSVFVIENLRVREFYQSNNTKFGETGCITPDPEHPGYAYIGTTNQSIIYAKIDGGIKEEKTWSTGDFSDFNALFPSEDGIYICSDEGIGFIGQDDEFYALTDLPMNNSVDSIMQDFEGNLWFTSSRQGIMKIVPNDFVNLTAIAGISDIVVNSTCYYHDLLYIGSDTGLIVLDKDLKQQKSRLTKMLEGIRIRSIRTYEDDCLYLATYSEHGLVIVTPEGDIHSLSSANGLSSDRVRATLALSDGSIATATSGGVNIVKDGKVQKILDAEKGVKNTEILCLAEKSDGTLLMGSDGDGIYIYKDGSVQRLGLADGLSSEVILRIAADPVEKDCFWIITGNRIQFLSANGKVEMIEKFPYADNFDILFDDNDNAWILSGTGIYVGQRANFFDNKSLNITSFDTYSELPTTPTANSYSCQVGDTFYIAGSTGVLSVPYKDALEAKDTLKLAVPYVYADDELLPIQPDQTVEIPADTKRLTIHSTAITYSLRNPKVQFCLQGFDDEPIVLTKRDFEPPTYTNLHGGTYTYVLSSLMPGTGEVADTTSITIKKQLAFYEHLWVRLLFMLSMIAIAVLITRMYFRNRTKKLEEAHARQKAFISQAINAFAKAIDYKDKYTNGHSFRVANYTRKIATHCGLDQERIDEIYNIALLHDIGKIAIPDEILNKPSALDDDEYQIMKTHAEIGEGILKEITSEPELGLGAGYHHERIDGKGYPHGLKGDDIPDVAQMIAVADTFDAMYSTRPYRKKLALSTVLEEIKRISGTQLNPKYVDVFVKLCEDGEVK